MAHSDHVAPTPTPAPASEKAVAAPAANAPAANAPAANAPAANAPAANAPAAEPSCPGLGRDLRVGAVLVVAALAFLLGSFPARNSDVWMPLAGGRQLARGPEFFSSVPHFAENPPHATWLYDLTSYAIYSAVGGPGLVIVKALVVVGLALVLLRLSAAGASIWIASLCTVLALLAISLRVPLD